MPNQPAINALLDVRDIVDRADLDPAGEVVEPPPSTYVVGAYEISEGKIALRTAEHRQPIFEGRQHCDHRLLLDVTGGARSNFKGEAIVNLSDYVCDEIDYGFPLNVVATPLTFDEVRFVTVLAVPTLSKIHFQTWRSDGTQGGPVRFYWRCRVGVKRSAT